MPYTVPFHQWQNASTTSPYGGLSADRLNDWSQGIAAAQMGINVKYQGRSVTSAVGDGATNDRAAIQAAFDAVPSTGGYVFFPPGNYLCSSPVTPKSGTTIVGTHIPRYQGTLVSNSETPCKLTVSGTFAGTGLMKFAGVTPSLRGIKVLNLGLNGNRQGSGIHGLQLPPIAEVDTEQNFLFENLTIHGFTGNGIEGRGHVIKMVHCDISNNAFGINASGSDKWNDSKIYGCYIYFNRSGGVNLTGGTTAYMDFVGCRFERNGTQQDAFTSPYLASAPGVNLAKAYQLKFLNCETDANAGNGFQVVAGGENVSNISFVNCMANRDGSGTNVTPLQDYAGFKISKGAGAAAIEHIHCVNCSTFTDDIDDAGTTGLVAPKWGVWFENTYQCSWIAARVGGVTNAYNFVGANNSLMIIDKEYGMLSLPTAAPSGYSGAGLPPAGMIYRTGANTLVTS